MLVAQITDLHLGFDPDDPNEPNQRRLDDLLSHIMGLDRQPDLLFVTGDLVDRGDVASYERLRRTLADLPFPVHICLGNHDRRAAFIACFPDTSIDPHGFVQYVVETSALRFIVLDTLEEGRHGGAFCADRAAWLDERLSEARDRPTVIVLHHPPIDTGIGWMTTAEDEPWVRLLRSTLAARGHVVAMLAGHIHRPLVTGWTGIPLVVCPSSAPQVALTLAPIDMERPDGRPMIVAGPPGLALHWWNGRELVTHFDDVAEPLTLAHYDARMQPLVRGMIGERPA